MKSASYLSLGLAALAALLAAGCSSDEKRPPRTAARAALVTVTKSVLTDMPVNLSAVGTVEASATVNVVSRTAGELLEVLVDDGEYVQEGQLLFIIDKKPAEIALHKVQAQLESDRAHLAKAEDDLARSQKLTRGGFTSAAQNDEARVAAVGYRAAVKADEAAVEQARLDLSYCEIRSPMAGRAGAVQVDKGNYVPRESKTLLTIDALQPVTVTFSVPERYLTAVRGLSAGVDLMVTATPRLGQAAEGTLTFVGNVDSATGTVPLKASFPNENGLLWPGEYVEIKLRLSVLKDSVAVPSRAVIIGPKGPFVYVIREGPGQDAPGGRELIAEYRLVASGTESDGMTVISQGLDAGEMVVMEGHVRLSDGIRVRLPENSADGPPGARPADAGADT
ncbi:MAG: efflux RND transporter periplasmic adaptor subunit [Desulfovibrionaceae bacterium]|nr:efflux RND transporter periplasmic adaptor subunit [Desulfovibrionaceae bacterium]